MPIHSHARWLATVPVLLLASGCAGSHSDSGTSLGGTGQVANQSNAGAGAGQANSSNLSQCGPTALPAWVEEGQSVSIAVLCATGRTVAGNAFTISELPAGAEYDPTTATLTWKPGLDQAGVYEVLVTVSPFNESGTIKIGVADAFDVAGNLPIADVTKYTEEYGLPVMHLTVPKQIEDNAVDPATGNKAWVPATIVYRGHTYSAEAKYRGASSLKYPKKNYSLRFPDTDQFNEDIIADAVKGRSHLELITTFDDPSQVRYRMALELWNRMDSDNIRVREFGLVLYVNGQFWGVYGASDKISASLFGHFGYSDAGNLYMGTDHNANFATFRYNESSPQVETAPKTDLAQGFEKKDGSPLEGQPGAFSDLTELVQFVTSSDDATFQSQLAERVDIKNYYNWFIHTTAIQAFDTLGKNSLHYHDPVAARPWRVVLWDFNESFGQRWQTARFETSVNPGDITYVATGGVGYTNRNYLWRRIWNNPSLSVDLKSRYKTLLQTTLTKAAVLTLLDRMVSETAACAKRDDRKWQTQYRSYFKSYRNNDFLDSTGEAAYVRSFVERRWDDLQKMFP